MQPANIPYVKLIYGVEISYKTEKNIHCMKGKKFSSLAGALYLQNIKLAELKIKFPKNFHIYIFVSESFIFSKLYEIPSAKILIIY